MHERKHFTYIPIIFLFLLAVPIAGFSQSGGSLRGVVTYQANGNPLHNVSVQIVQLRRSVETDASGAYEFQQIPPGTYTVLAHMEGFPDVAQTVRVAAGSNITLDFQMRLVGVREQVTVTATGSEQSTFESFQAVTTLDSTRLAEESHPSIGEVLDKEPGIAKRSFGPGSARPVIRGFDGDRVLVLQDGVRTGSLASQSGDHGEPIEVLSLERLEVVKGPATLLYGSNAIGGVVNAVTGHDDHGHEGLRGYFSGLAGTTNNQAGISGGLEYGHKDWLFWGNGSGQRTGDYETPIGRIINSKTRVGNGSGGLGYYRDKAFFNASYGYDNRHYGVPFASRFEGGGDESADHEAGEELIDLKMRRHDLRLSAGFRDVNSFINSFRMTFNYNDYQHQEIEDNQVGTTFKNQQLIYRGVFDQRRAGRLSGSFGFWGMHRDYESVGAEVLVQGPVTQNAFAVFGLQEIDFERVRFQFGGRLENNRYRPTGLDLPDRSFTGFSGAAGVRLGLWHGGAFIVNYTHSYRAPALEELYNFGPHIGNLTFEIGNPNLTRERGDGIELSLRHTSSRVRAEANFYYYNLKDFVFLAPVDEDLDGVIDVEDGLTVAEYLQADSRFMGTELNLDLGLHRNLWVNLGLDTVDAQLKETGMPLPRIPPLRGRLGLDVRYKGLSLRPEA
ncbi:MAG TPA: TonB-dependent receptor, partial [Pyrinomonadaceae bacterium]|nr:TonB-dependent receptor [Pyrinomonadaceae bacterium]